MNYTIVLESPTSLTHKLVRVYLEDAGEFRQIERSVRQEVEVLPYVEARFSELWDIASPLPEYEWNAASENAFRELYQAVAEAALQAAKGQSAELTDVIAAMEAAIAASPKAGAYSKLQTMAGNSTAAQRDNFFLVVSFLVLGQLTGSA